MSLNSLMSLAFRTIEFKIEGNEFKVKELSHEDFKKYQKTLFTVKNGIKEWHTENIKIGLVKACLVDEDGKKLFKASDDSLIDRLPERLIDEIFKQAEKVNSLDETEEEKIKN